MVCNSSRYISHSRLIPVRSRREWIRKSINRDQKLPCYLRDLLRYPQTTCYHRCPLGPGSNRRSCRQWLNYGIVPTCMNAGVTVTPTLTRHDTHDNLARESVNTVRILVPYNTSRRGCDDMCANSTRIGLSIHELRKLTWANQGKRL